MSRFQPKFALVRVLEDDRNPPSPLGAGVLASKTHVITCAHVLPDSAVKPGDPVLLDFPGIPGHPGVKARIKEFLPPADSPAGDGPEDLALLEIDDTAQLPAEAAPAPLAVLDEPDLIDKQIMMMGFPATHRFGDWIYSRLKPAVATGYVQFDSEPGERFTAPGFSGTPVWNRTGDAVFGLVVADARRQAVTSGYMIPAEIIVKAFPQLKKKVAANRLDQPVHMLHLSDLHIQTEADARDGFSALADDLAGDLKVERLAAAIVSGDIGNVSTPEEYAAGKVFFDLLKSEFKLDSARIVLVPGNHDVNWKLSRKGYALMEREDCEGRLEPGRYIDVDDDVVRLRNEGSYKNRFDHFSAFYEAVRGFPYPLEYDHQAVIQFYPECNILILALNSAWEIDYHFKSRASIHPGAVAEALNRIRNSKTYREALKLAVFHHPAESPFEDRITDHGFMERLAAAGFCACLHGHIHKTDTRCFRYDIPAGGRSLTFIGAGTFGAPIREWTPGHPLQYNLLEFEGDRLTVKTRCRMDLRGAWRPHAIWPQGPGKEPLSRYTVDLPRPVGPADTSESGVHVEALHGVPDKYRAWIGDHCRDMDLTRLIGTSPAIRARMPEIFIPLTADPPDKGESKREGDMMRMMERSRAEDIESLMAKHPRLIVQGDAGSGKTTLFKHMAYGIIKHDPPHGVDAGLPVLLFLKDIPADALDPTLKNAQAFEKLLDRYYIGVEGGLTADIIRPWAAAGKALLLVDGLDEIPPERRAKIMELLAGYSRAHPDCRIALSGRPHGVDTNVVRWFDAPVVKIKRLGPDQIRLFISKWFANVSMSDGDQTKKTAEDMIGEIQSHDNIQELVDNPLMLTAVCLLYLDNKELPGQRAELYHKFVDNLLHRRFQEPEKIRNFLTELAHSMHIAEKRGIDKFDAVNVLCGALADPDACRKDMEARFDEIEPACALLTLEDGRYIFRHLTFQEFLAAAHMAETVRADHFAEIEKFWDKDWYAEVVELFVGYVSMHNRGVANEIVRKILAGNAGEDYKRWLLAGCALLDIHVDRRDAPVVKAAQDRMQEIMASEAAPNIRAGAGELLGRMGDPRKLKEFIRIPGGTYKLSLGEVNIEPFEIGKYPVTNGWFREFVEDKGYEREAFWTEQGRVFLAKRGVKAPAFWHDRKWNCPNAPVVGVSWYEADAFIRWLNQTADDKHTYFLPDEIQWEAAASGMDGRKYPWGPEWIDDACNSKECGLEKTTSAGVFPKGNTPEGIVDMAGNIWEWTRTNFYSKTVLNDFLFDGEIWDLYLKWDQSEGEKKEELRTLIISKLNETDRQLPVARGGSWYNDKDESLCGVRNWFNPYDWNDLRGFRCFRT